MAMRHQRKGMHALWRASPFSGSVGPVWSDLADSKEPHCGRGREVPCFGVEAAVRAPLSKGGYPCSPAKASRSRLREKLKIGMRNGLGYPACRHPTFAGFRYSRACPTVRPLPVWRGGRRVAATADRLKYVDLQRVKANR